MTIDEHLEALQREGEMLAGAAERVDPGAGVPSCPEWTARDLVHHIGRVHRRAAHYVREARRHQIKDRAESQEIYGPMPGDAALVAWYREGHGRLVEALRDAPADLACWTFLPAASPRAFWSRRQAHETAIHRYDMELALGAPAGYPAEFATDGIDELVMGFLGDASRSFRSGLSGRLAVNTTDTDGSWRVELGPDQPRSSRGPGPADCTVSGLADTLYPLLWNRTGPEAVEVSGDAGLLEAWRRTVVISGR